MRREFSTCNRPRSVLSNHRTSRYVEFRRCLVVQIPYRLCAPQIEGSRHRKHFPVNKRKIRFERGGGYNKTRKTVTQQTFFCLCPKMVLMVFFLMPGGIHNRKGYGPYIWGTGGKFSWPYAFLKWEHFYDYICTKQCLILLGLTGRFCAFSGHTTPVIFHLTPPLSRWPNSIRHFDPSFQEAHRNFTFVFFHGNERPAQKNWHLYYYLRL